MRLAPGGMNWYEIGHQDVLSLKIDQAVSPGAFSRPFRIVEASNVTGQFKQMIDGESAGNERSGGRGLQNWRLRLAHASTNGIHLCLSYCEEGSVKFSDTLRVNSIQRNVLDSLSKHQTTLRFYFVVACLSH